MIEAKGTAVGFVEKRGEIMVLAAEEVTVAEPTVLEGTDPDIDGAADGAAELEVLEVGELALPGA